VARALYVWQFRKALGHLVENVVLPNAHVADAGHAADGLAKITDEAPIMGADRLANDTLLGQTAIRIAFILSAMALAWIDTVGQRPQRTPAARAAATVPPAVPATPATDERAAAATVVP